MYQTYYILVLCLCLLGGSLAAKRENGGRKKQRAAVAEDDWQHTNSMSLQEGEEHLPMRTYDTINIDDDGPQDDMFDDWGSGYSNDDYSGDGRRLWDDEDINEEASGNGLDEMTSCERLRDSLAGRSLKGAYIPACTAGGDFEKTQCWSSTGVCWCVDAAGAEIDDTRRSLPKRPDCDNLPRNPKPPKVGPPKQRQPSKNAPEPENEIGEALPEEEENPTVEIVTISTHMPGNQGDPMSQENRHPVQQYTALTTKPGILAGVIGGAVVGLLCAVLLVMFIVYRMRKKDEGSYTLDGPKRAPSPHTYSRASNREFYA